ncbi:MAG TPA: tetratricopeptide repeat protein [Thermoanaerobaculia bacterium]|nr:tetratricopeptide repeat protein [Thermoanaerobaculia bacterium]
MNVDWLSAVAMLLSGLIGGFMIVYSMRPRDEKSDLEMRDLEAKRDALLAALRADVDSPEERAKLERETADVLRALDDRSKKRLRGTATPAAPPPAPARGSSFKGFAWGAGSVLVLVGIGYFVAQSAKPKEEMPAQQASAMAPNAAGQQPPDPALQSLEQAVQKTPTDLGLRTELAKAYLDRENMMATYEQTQYVLERSPKDARALTYQSIVRIAMGQVDSARQMLDTATKSDPDLIDAWVAMAWADTIGGKDAEAQQAIDEATKHHPDQKERLAALLARMRQDQKATAAKLPANHPAVPPPPTETSASTPAPQPATPAPAAPAASGGSVKVTLQLAPGKTIPPNAVIWLMARDAGTSSGPPLAVKRVAIGAFPVTVDFGAADSMMGQPLPAKMRIDARVDSHGNPMVHDPNDPAAAQDGVANGSSVTLTLK